MATKAKPSGDAPAESGPELKPFEMAAHFLEEADGDIDRASAALADHLLTDPQLLRAHLGALVESWARNQISGVIAKRRAVIIAAQSSAKAQADRLDTAFSNNAARLMDMPLYGGKRLRDATPDEVRESARQYGLLAKTSGTQARWQEQVAAATEKHGGKDARVGAALSEATLAKLWEEAENA